MKIRIVFIIVMSIIFFNAKSQVTTLAGDYKIINIGNNTSGDYTRSLILLHEVYNGTLIDHNYAIGTITAMRGTSGSYNRLNVVNVTTSSAYSGISGTITSNDDNSTWVLKTCIYNGKKYLAVDIPYADAHHSWGYYFNGSTVSTGENMKCVSYEVNGTPVNTTLISNIQDFSSNMVETHNVAGLNITGNVGIGTSAPRSLFEVNGAISTTGESGIPSNGTGVELTYQTSAGRGRLLAYDRTNNIYKLFNINDNLYVSGNNGNVGIGTIAPIMPLQVNGTIYSATPVSNSNAIGTSLAADLNYNFIGYAGYWGLRTATNSSYNVDVYNSGTPITAMTILQNGNIAIGTTDPKGYKLAVAGDAIAESMTVDLQANWPDYVFKKDYSLAPLSEIKTYIDKNQHLPGVPTAEEVSKKGINLGEMNALLMKKVEELTLYLIDKDKEIKELKTTQDERIKKLEQRLQFLEKQ